MVEVISEPSGAGKTTVCRTLVERVPSLRYSISVTTREPRRGEKEGLDYVFVCEEEFECRRSRGEFLESAVVHGHSYGTPGDFVAGECSAGRDVLLDVDVQGAMAVREAFPRAVLILLVPPSRAELERRLRRRQRDSEQDVRRRLSRAARELSRFPDYDYVVVNCRVEAAAKEVEAIMRAEQLRSHRMGCVVEELLHSDKQVQARKRARSEVEG